MYATTSEINLFVKFLADSRTYVEFGSGGSTFLACYLTQAEIFSVESNPAIITALSQNSIIAQASDRLQFYPVDIGEVQKWGFPAHQTHRHNFPLYSQGIFSSLDSTKRKEIDTIFIDGRFRVACGLNAIFHCPHSTILIHDFFNRPHYHILLDFLECIARADTLGVFRLKGKPSPHTLTTLLHHYQFDPM